MYICGFSYEFCKLKKTSIYSYLAMNFSRFGHFKVTTSKY